MPDSTFQLSPEQKDRLEYLNSMIAYVNHATGCVLYMEKGNSPCLYPEHIDGFMLLSAHLAEEVQHVLDALTFSPGQHTNKDTITL